MEEGEFAEEIKQTLMPEGKCSRCGDEEVAYNIVFNLTSGTVTLGFCSNPCEYAFCAGIEGIRHSQVVL